MSLGFCSCLANFISADLGTYTIICNSQSTMPVERPHNPHDLSKDERTWIVNCSLHVCSRDATV